LTVCDVKPRLSAAFAEELKHVTASLGFDVEIYDCSEDEDVIGADVILISAGEPRVPGVNMSRRDLAKQNARIVKNISEATASRNPNAKYVVISNPVDAMAMICKTYTKADFVISTGTNLESLRFRSKIAKTLSVPVYQIQGWVGGEHGDAAVPLWSTVRINNLTVNEYATSKGIIAPQGEIDSYVKSVSKFIVDTIGGTEYGPAASFRDIIRAIIKDTNAVLSIATPMSFNEVPEPVFVSVPTHLGKSIGSSLREVLSKTEKAGLKKASKAIYQTYKIAIENLE
jgi:malate dehydrogenase